MRTRIIIELMSNLVNPIAILFQSEDSDAWRQFVDSKLDELNKQHKELFAVFGEIHKVPELSKTFNKASEFWNFPYSVIGSMSYPAMSYAAVDENENLYAVRLYNGPGNAEKGNQFLAALRQEYAGFCSANSNQ